MKEKKLLLMYLIFGASVAATVGSLYFSEIKGLPPCILCWYQRIAIYPIMFISAVAILREDMKAHFYIFPLAAIGWCVALYQNLLIYGVLEERLAPCANGISCTQDTISWFGFITLPLLSFATFSAILVGLWMFSKNSPSAASESAAKEAIHRD